jgi:CRP/FNR family transcriptional regulator
VQNHFILVAVGEDEGVPAMDTLSTTPTTVTTPRSSGRGGGVHALRAPASRRRREADLRADEERERRRSLVAQLPLFSGLRADAVDAVADIAELRKAAPGTYVAVAGEPARAATAVIFGQIQLLVGSPDGETSVLSLVGPGQTFGEAAVWLGVEYPVSARATQETLLLTFPGDALVGLVQRRPELALRFLTRVSEGLQHLVANIGSHKQKSGEQRLAAYLLELPSLDGEKPIPRVRLPASKGTVASLMSMQPETLSRILRRFQEQGLIEMRGRELTICRPQALRTLVDATPEHRH